MNVIVMSRSNVCKLFRSLPSEVKKKYACIAIKGMEDEDLPKWIYPKVSLYLTFDDSDSAVALDGLLNEVPMSNNDAYAIAGFVKTISNSEMIQTLIVHCEAGMSRSAGVAAAIMKWMNNDDTPIFNTPKYRPNMYCYRTTLNALMDEQSGPMNIEFAKALIVRAMDEWDWNMENLKLKDAISTKQFDGHLIRFECEYDWKLNAWTKHVETHIILIKHYAMRQYIIMAASRHEPIDESIVQEVIEDVKS